MKYTCGVSMELTFDIEADIHDGHAYLRKATLLGVDVLPAVQRNRGLLEDLEERVWQRWYSDVGEGL